MGEGLLQAKSCLGFAPQKYHKELQRHPKCRCDKRRALTSTARKPNWGPCGQQWYRNASKPRSKQAVKFQPAVSGFARGFPSQRVAGVAV